MLRQTRYYLCACMQNWLLFPNYCVMDTANFAYILGSLESIVIIGRNILASLVKKDAMKEK